MLHHEDILTSPLSRKVQEDIEALLRAIHGKGGQPRVVGASVLSCRLSVVLRVAIDPCGTPAPRSVVVKHLHPRWYGSPRHPEAPPEFGEEVAAYDFLSSLDPGFKERPLQLDYHPNGLLLLEDVGPGDTAPLPFPLVGPRVGILLARLHAATTGRLDGFHACRRRHDLSMGPDLRSDGETAAHMWFEQGLTSLAEWCRWTGVADEAATRRWLEPVVEAMVAPSPLDVLIHDDLANGRQCVVRDGRMRLVDFENAKPGHPLRDVAKVMIGKFERDLETSRMIFMCPRFDHDLTRAYRAALAEGGGPSWSNDDWHAVVATAMVHATVVQVGRLRGLVERTCVSGDLLGNLRALLLRLEEVLENNPHQSEIRERLKALAERIALP